MITLRGAAGRPRPEHGRAICAAFLLSTVGVITGVGNLGFNVIIARFGGDEAYGSVGALLSVSTLAGFLAVGLQYAVARRVATGTLSRPVGLVRLSSASAASGGVTLVGLLVLAGVLTSYLHLKTPVPALLTMLIVVIVIVTSLPLGMAIGLRLFGGIAAVQVLSVCVRLVGAFAGSRIADATVTALAATAVSGVVLAGGLTLIVRRSPEWQRMESASRPAGQLAIDGLLGALASSALWSFWSLPLIFARHGLTGQQAGSFAAAQILCSSILFLAAPIVSVFYPMFARSLDVRLAWLGLAATLFLCTAGLVYLSLFGPDLMRRVYGTGYSGSRGVFTILSVSAGSLALLTYGFWMLRAVSGSWRSPGVSLLVGLVVVVTIGSSGASQVGLDGSAAAIACVVSAAAYGVLALAGGGRPRLQTSSRAPTPAPRGSTSVVSPRSPSAAGRSAVPEDA